MTSVYALLLVVLVVALLGRLRADAGHRSPGFAALVDSGLVVLPVGAALGPLGVGLVHVGSLELLDPLLNLAVCWLGLVMGLQLRVRDLKRLPRRDWVLSGLQYGVAFAAVLAGMWGLLALLGRPEAGREALLLAVVAGTSSATVIAHLLQGSRLARSARGRAALVLANLDNLHALSLLGFAGLVFFPHRHFVHWPGAAALLAPPLASLALAFVFHYFLRRAMREGQQALLLAGLLTFSGGAAAVLEVSPAVLGLLIGFWLANQSRDANVLYRFMVAVEGPVFLSLALMAGLLWQPAGLRPWTLLGLLAAYVLLRGAAKVAAWSWVSRLGRLPAWPLAAGGEERPRLAGLLLPMGGLPLAVALSEAQLHGEEGGALLLALTVPATLLSVVATAWPATRVKRRTEPRGSDG